MYVSLNIEEHAGSLHPGPFSDGRSICTRWSDFAVVVVVVVVLVLVVVHN